MPNDQEYLEKFGVKDEAAPVETTPETPQTPQEMFELGENKFPLNTEFKLTHGGELLKVPASNMFNKFRQAKFFEDRWSQAKPQLEEYTKIKPEYEKYKGFYDKYGQIQEWSEKNPQEWQKLWSLYQQKDQLLNQQAQTQPGTPANNAYEAKIQALEQKLSQLENFKTEFEKGAEQVQIQEDTENILKEKDEWQKEWPEIDLNKKDPEGVSDWTKVIQYGIANNIKNFKDAADLYYRSILRDTLLQRGRNEAVKGIKTDVKQGVVKRSSAPILGQATQAPRNIRDMSYGELADMAKNGQFNVAS